MQLIIDAYNILKQVLPRLYIEESERTSFIAQLAGYARARKNCIVLVFDGEPAENKPLKEQVGLVCVVYAGWNVQADSFICNYVKKHHQNKDLLLVSSDRKLCDAVAVYQVPSIDAMLFYAMLEQIDEKPKKERTSEQLIKVKGETANEESVDKKTDIDILMQEFCQEVLNKDVVEHEDRAYNRTSKAYTPSKKERALLKKIKKL